jgi:fatty-acid desaturase
VREYVYNLCKWLNNMNMFIFTCMHIHSAHTSNPPHTHTHIPTHPHTRRHRGHLWSHTEGIHSAAAERSEAPGVAAGSVGGWYVFVCACVCVCVRVLASLLVQSGAAGTYLCVYVYVCVRVLMSLLV